MSSVEQSGEMHARSPFCSRKGSGAALRRIPRILHDTTGVLSPVAENVFERAIDTYFELHFCISFWCF